MVNPRHNHWWVKATTTDRHKCCFCKQKVHGEQGFLYIERDHNISGKILMRICKDCVCRIYKEFKLSKRRLKEGYKNQVKRTMVNRL